jgi:hypothetical protein
MFLEYYEIPKSKYMNSKKYTYNEQQLSDILNEIWQNRNSIDQKDIEQLQKFASKPCTHEQ